MVQKRGEKTAPPMLHYNGEGFTYRDLLNGV